MEDMQALYATRRSWKAPGKIRTAAEENINMEACGGISSGPSSNLRLDCRPYPVPPSALSAGGVPEPRFDRAHMLVPYVDEVLDRFDKEKKGTEQE
jgi:hypothetical protein